MLQGSYGEDILTFDGFGDGPEVRAAVHIPLDISGRLRSERVVSVRRVLVRVQVIAIMAQMSVRMLLVAEDSVDAGFDFSKDRFHCSDRVLAQLRLVDDLPRGPRSLLSWQERSRLVRCGLFVSSATGFSWLRNGRRLKWTRS